MKLYEFFGSKLDMKGSDPSDHDQEEKKKLMQDIFYYIIDHDDIHKSHFLEVARQVHKNPAKEHHPKIWLPMVNKACMEYYKEMKLEGNPTELFDKKSRGDLCKKCADHYHKDILMGEYNLGKH
jgi:methionyl-tRNA synthetase